MLLRGEKIVRTPEDESPVETVSSAVPATGRRARPREEPDTGGMEPQPQS